MPDGSAAGGIVPRIEILMCYHVRSALNSRDVLPSKVIWGFEMGSKDPCRKEMG